WDWESHWAQDLPWRPSVALGHRAQIQTWYERLWRDHVAVDFAYPEDDLSGYRVVLAPASYLLTDAGRRTSPRTCATADAWWSDPSPGSSIGRTACARAG